MKFSFSKAASTLSLAALGVAAATSAQAAISSINVEVAKVTLFENSASAQGNGVVVFDAVNNIGGTSNVTVDLLNSTDAAGKSVPLRNLTTSEAGVYRTAVVEIVKVEAEDDSATPVTTDLSAILTAAGTDPLSGNPVIVLGENVVDGGGDDVNDIFGIATSTAAMKPVVTAGGVVTLPTLDIQLPAAAVVDNGAGTAQLVEAPKFATVAPASAATTNDTAIRDVVITIAGDAAASALGTGLATDETRTITAGLFSSILVDTPVYSTTVEVTATDADDFADTNVTFADVAYGTYLPIAWVDADEDGKLDAGERFAIHDITAINDGSVAFTSANASTSTTDDDVTGFAASHIIETGLAGLPPRFNNYIVDITNSVTGTDAAVDDIELSLTLANFDDNAGAGVAAGAAGSIIVTTNGTAITLPVTWYDNADDSIALVDDADALPALSTTATTTIGAVSSLSYDATNEKLTIKVPYTAVTAVTATGYTATEAATTLDVTIVDGTAAAIGTAGAVDVATAIADDTTVTNTAAAGIALAN